MCVGLQEERPSGKNLGPESTYLTPTFGVALKRRGRSKPSLPSTRLFAMMSTGFSVVCGGSNTKSCGVKVVESEVYCSSEAILHRVPYHLKLPIGNDYRLSIGRACKTVRRICVRDGLASTSLQSAPLPHILTASSSSALLVQKSGRFPSYHTADSSARAITSSRQQ